MPSTYQIELFGFPGVTRDEAAERLAQRFNIEVEKAGRFVDRAPCVVRSGVTGKVARAYTRDLVAVGADVRVIDQTTGEYRAYGAVDIAHLERLNRNGIAGGGRNNHSDAFLTAARDEPDPFVKGDGRLGVALYCPSCGHQQPPAEHCEKCGRWVSADYSSVVPSRGGFGVQAESSEEAGLDSSKEIDVFESLGDRALAGRHQSPQSGTGLTSRARSPRRRRRRRQYDPFSAQYRKWYLVALIVLMLVAAYLILAELG